MPKPIEPIRYFHDTNGWDDGGMILSVFGFTFTIQSFEDMGFMKGHDFIRQNWATVFINAPFDGHAFVLKSGPEHFKKSVKRLTENPFSFYFDEDHLNPCPVGGFAPFETVNTHQWEGTQPIERRDGKGHLVDREPPLWDVVSVLRYDRMLFFRGHHPRDEIFGLNQRLNERLQYWQAFNRMFEDDIRTKNPEGYGSANRYPEGSAERQSALELYEDMAKEIEENPPPFFTGWDVKTQE